MANSFKIYPFIYPFKLRTIRTVDLFQFSKYIPAIYRACCTLVEYVPDSAVLIVIAALRKCNSDISVSTNPLGPPSMLIRLLQAQMKWLNGMGQ